MLIVELPIYLNVGIMYINPYSVVIGEFGKNNARFADVVTRLTPTPAAK